MNEQDKFKVGAKAENQLQASEIATEQEVSQYFAFADPILHVDWGAEGLPEEYTPEYIVAHPEATKIFVIKNGSNEIIGGAKIKKLTEEDARRLGLNKGPFSNQDGALLEYTVVREDYRNQGLLTELTQKRIDWAKERGIDYVCAEIAIDTPISAHTKIRDGFMFIDIRMPGAGISVPYFIAVKPLYQESKTAENEVNKEQPERKEVEVNETSFEELRGLFDEGWVGVNIKLGGESDAWILILERQ